MAIFVLHALQKICLWLLFYLSLIFILGDTSNVQP